MGSDLVIVARTDALSALFLDSNGDPIDHPHILGITNPKNPSKLQTYVEAGIDAINETFKDDSKKREHLLKEWVTKTEDKSLKDSKLLA